MHATLSHVFGDQTEEHRLGEGIAVRRLVLRVRREAPQLRPDLAALIEDLQGAATEHREGFRQKLSRSRANWNAKSPTLMTMSATSSC